jgi:hypothetical protein
MPIDKDPSDAQSQEPKTAEEERYERAREIDPGLPKPGEEIQINLKKFALVLGAILIFSAVFAVFNQ